MKILDLFNKNQVIVGLAPMADLTDSPFCQTIAEIGGNDFVVREMISSEALVRDNKKTQDMIAFDKSERPIIQQLFGSEPKIMAQAAQLVLEKVKPDGIDINMGCPARKITGSFNGCALMKDPALAVKIVSTVKAVLGKTPLSVKMRLGWKDPDTFKTFIPLVESAGADFITLHGRTKEQGYGVKCDWERIKQAKEIAKVPLVANGDVLEPEQVNDILVATKADGVLIARGALGNPWFFKQTKQVGFRVSLDEKIRIVMRHLKLHVKHYGGNGVITFRKHLAWYFKSQRMGLSIQGLKGYRSRLVLAKTIKEVQEILQEMVKNNRSLT